MAKRTTLLPQNDKEILDHLLAENGTGRRRGEEMLFSSYAYFVREGEKKFRLTEEEAFDAYSETFLSAISTISGRAFRGNSSLKTFLYRIYQNKCVDLLRKKTTKKNSIHRTLSITEFAPQISDAAKSILQQLAEATDFHLLRLRLNELGEKCRRLLLLSAEGYTDRMICQELEYKTMDVVKTSRLRCLEKLRQLYQQQR